MTRTAAYLSIGSGALLALVAGWFALSWYERAHTARAQATATEEDYLRAAQLTDLGGSRDGDVLETTLKELALDDLGSQAVGGLDGAEALADVTTAFLGVYQSADAAAFRDLLRSQGLEPDMLPTEEQYVERFKRLASHVMGAKFYPEHSEWAVLVLGGRCVLPESNRPTNTTVGGGAKYVMRLDSPRGPSDIVDAERAKATQVRLLLPADLTDAEGKITRCRLELVFTRRPSDGEWLLTGTGLQNVPLGHPIGSPPLR